MRIKFKHFDWSRIISISATVLIVMIVIAASFSGSRIVGGVRQKESQNISVGLRNSVEHFFDDYGKLPSPTSGAPSIGDVDTDSGGTAGLIAMLVGRERTGAQVQNPRGISYLDDIKSAKPGKKAGGPPWLNGLVWEPALDQYSIVDGWGNTYRVRLDMDGDGLLANPCIDEVDEGRIQLNQRALVWSPGKDGKEETWTDNPKSWD